MDKEQRYALEALEAVREARHQLDEAMWRLRFIGDTEYAVRLESLIVLLLVVTPGAA